MSDRVLQASTLTLPASATWWSTVWGAVGVTNGQTTVTGTGFGTTRPIRAGQSVSFANQSGTVYTVASVTSATALELTSAFTGATNAATAMGFGTNPEWVCDKQARFKGLIYSSAAPSTIQVELSPDDGSNFPKVIPLTADAGSSGVYSFDINLVGANKCRLILTDAGAGSTVRLVLWTADTGSGPDVVGGVTPGPAPPSPTLLPSTYRVAFDAIAFGSAGGNFLELSNPAGSGRVLRATLQQLCKPSATVRWRIRKQSTLDTGGTSTTPTPTPLDSNNAATVGVVKLYTVAPTLGTLVGSPIWSQSVTAGDIVEDDPGINQTLTQPVVLRPGQSVAWNSDVAATMQGTIEFTDAAA